MHYSLIVEHVIIFINLILVKLCNAFGKEVPAEPTSGDLPKKVTVVNSAFV